MCIFKVLPITLRKNNIFKVIYISIYLIKYRH